VHVNAGYLTHYPGGYQYYLDKTQAQSERAGLTAQGKDALSYAPVEPGARRDAAAPGGAATRKEQKRLEAEQRQARSRERKSQQQLVQQLEQEIHELEARQTELTEELEKAETYEKPGRAVEINRELIGIQDRLAQATPEWEREATRLQEMNKE
jgi:ATP-binding cassette subfamily F protein 3